MKQPEIRKIVVWGAGKVASALVPALKRKGFVILQVLDCTASKAKKLAGKAGAEWTDNPGRMIDGADLYIISVSDDAIRDVASGMKKVRGLVVHTSGSTGMNVLEDLFPRCGVLYPLQSFSGSSRISFRRIPMCIEANSGESVERLKKVAGKLSEQVFVLNGDERRTLHVGAVLVNNFSNYLNSMAEELLQQHHLPYEILFPIICKTARNACAPGVFSRQTGPAVREDAAVIREHIELLKKHPDYLEIYQLITESIKKRKHLHEKL